jgi:hypothetical protein
MKNKIFIGIIAAIFAAILIFEYNLNDKYQQQPPSKKWSKEVSVADTKSSTCPDIIRTDSGSIIVYQDGNKIKAAELDKAGKIKASKSFNAEGTFTSSVCIIKDTSNYKIAWSVINKSNYDVYILTLDNNLDEVGRRVIDNAVECKKVDANSMIITSKDKIEFINTKYKNDISVNSSNPSLACGTYNGSVYLIAYYNNEYFNCLTIKNGAAGAPKKIIRYTPQSFTMMLNSAIACDDKYGYILFENRPKGAFGNLKSITFKLDGSSCSVNDFNMKFIGSMFSPYTISSGNKAVFAAGAERSYARKDSQYDIIDFTLKNGEMTEYNFMSRTDDATLETAVDGDTALFLDTIGDSSYKIYLTSTDPEFRKIYNVPMQFEKVNAFYDTLTGLLNSIVYIFTTGMMWILPGFALISIMSLFAYSMLPKKKAAVYTIIYIIVSAIKVFIVYNIYYKQYSYAMPQLLSNMPFGLCLAAAISLLCLLNGLKHYKNNPYSLPIKYFAINILIDSLLTQMIFVPFIA